MLKEISTTAKVVAGAVFFAIVAALLAWHFWSAAHSEKVNARVDQGQAGANMNASAEAIRTLGNNADRAAAIDQSVKEATDEIQRADAGNSNDAADRATCGLRSYRNTRHCRELLDPHPK